MTKYRDKSSLREMYATVYLISAFLAILLFSPSLPHSWSFLVGWKNGFLSAIWPWNSLLSKAATVRVQRQHHMCVRTRSSVSMGSNGRGSVYWLCWHNTPLCSLVVCVFLCLQCVCAYFYSHLFVFIDRRILVWRGWGWEACREREGGDRGGGKGWRDES